MDSHSAVKGVIGLQVRSVTEIALLARLAIVSVDIVNADGEFFQPMGKTNGKAMSGSAPACVGKMMPR